jgi:pyruvate,water dikinase
MTPLSGDVWFASMGFGIRAAARELRAPFGGFETMLSGGGWAYEHELEPDWEPNPRVMRAAALEVADRWEREYRPRSHELTEAIRRLRPERPPPQEAAELLDELLRLVREQWTIHFLTVMPVHALREILHDAWVERFGKRDELEPYRLIEGLPNETLDADESLWRVARLAREHDVSDVVAELPAAEALRRLATTHDGREVLHALSGHLRRFGGRSRLHELSEPREAEQPAVALEAVRLYLEHPRDLPAERRAREAERARAEREALERIEDVASRADFADVLRRVVAGVPLEESHAYHIDYPGLQATREALLGFGRRLVGEGRLERSDDVWLLRLAELRDAIADSWGAGLQALVGARRRELAQARASEPQPFLGPAPPADAEVPAAVAKFYGVPGSARRDGDLLRGTPASPGRARGTARVVRGAADFSRITPSDVLICTTTTPAWTPLFASVAALVTDTGGILCHAAVVAREYGLPAVVGAEVATRTIPDGSLVEVDGERGEVRIVRGPAS